MIQKTSLKPEDLIIKRKNVISRSLDGQIIILSPESDHPFRLNEVGAKIWESMGRRKRVDDLINSIRKFYQVDGDKAFRDVIAFLDELMERNLIRTG